MYKLATATCAILLAMFLVADVTTAQKTGGNSAPVPEGNGLPCLCFVESETLNPICAEDFICDSTPRCMTSADCPTGMVCIDDDNFCFLSFCALPCEDPNCVNPGSTQTGFEECEFAAPTMGQWGLIALAAVLLALGIFRIARSGRGIRPAAIVLVLLALGIAGWSYTSIQSNPKTCSQVSALGL